jgi:hypothetical protein
MSWLFWKKKESPALRAGTITVGKDPAGFLVMKVSGVISPQAVSGAQAKILALGSRQGRLRGLIDATEFQGWVKGFDGGSAEIEKMFSVDEITERIAVVADRAWHENLGLFLGTWMRKTPIKFFSVEERMEAMSWLQGKPA